MFTTAQLPAVFTAMANTGRILIVSGDPASVAPKAVKDACLLMKDDHKIVPVSVGQLFEEPELLDAESIIVLTDATAALKDDSESFIRFMSLAQRRDYKAVVVAPVELTSYDSHAAQYCINVRATA